MLGNISQLCFGGVSTKTVCFVSSGRVVLFHTDLQMHTAAILQSASGMPCHAGS